MPMQCLWNCHCYKLLGDDELQEFWRLRSAHRCLYSAYQVPMRILADSPPLKLLQVQECSSQVAAGEVKWKLQLERGAACSNLISTADE